MDKMAKKLVLKFSQVGIKDVPLVGGKNASLGEMIKHLKPKGVKIPEGFVVTAAAYQYFIKETGLDKFIKQTLKGLDTGNVKDLARRGELIRTEIKSKKLPEDLAEKIIKAYREMERVYGRNVDVAVRSSATAEDLPGASFAGEHDTYLNVRGQNQLLKSIVSAMASLFTDRAISYREDKHFDHFKVSLSVGVQKMVRSDLNGSGVMFTLDTESGFKDVVLINATWGLGELIVQGEVIPDEYLVFKPNLAKKGTVPIIYKKLGVKDRKIVYTKARGVKSIKLVSVPPRDRVKFMLNDREIIQLARWGKMIEDYYTKLNKKWTPMDIEWAKDGRTGELFIVQARPETVHAGKKKNVVKVYRRQESGQLLAKGISVGSKIAFGKARVILNPKHISRFQPGEILVTDMTDPDWEPIMKIASAIITNKGGRTSHAAIVSRELGIPGVVGAGNATAKIKTGEMVTVDTTGSEGLVFRGKLKFKVETTDVGKLPRPKTKIMVNIATPENAFDVSFLPNDGVGLAREEFIIASAIGIHPMALINFKSLPPNLKKRINKKVAGWEDKVKFYVDNLAFGIARIAAAFYPKKVIVRFSDFKTNEYRTLLGGEFYEPEEENPMLGWRGASRYYHPDFAPAFALECLALKKVRQEMGLDNAVPMIPFCRTPEEGEKVLKIMARNGLARSKDKTLKIYMMGEIPSNVLLVDKFLDLFDGISIGSNDLTQLTLGLDRDSGIVAGIANENNESVKRLVAALVRAARRRKKYIGICGQAPSDYPEFAQFLVKEKIESISLNPDVVVKAVKAIYQVEGRLKKNSQ